MESFNHSNFFIHDVFEGMDNHRSSQTKAALTKFRLKRKDRCFEKKVYYITTTIIIISVKIDTIRLDNSCIRILFLFFVSCCI